MEVEDGFYQLYMWMKDSWFLMYRFERDLKTRGPKTSDKETTLELCKMVHESPGFIPIRDKYVKVALQTSDSNLGMDSCNEKKCPLSRNMQFEVEKMITLSVRAPA